MNFTQYTLGLLLLLVGVIHGAQNWEDDFGFNDRQRYATEDEDGSSDEDYDPRKEYPDWPSDEDDTSGDGYDWNKKVVDSEEEGSADWEDPWANNRITECEKLMKKNKNYRCTASGAFEAMQCDRREDCWCVNDYGQEIPSTRSYSGSANCDGLDRKQRIDDGYEIEGPINKVDSGVVEGGNPSDSEEIDIDGPEEPKPKSNENGSLFETATEPTHRAGLLMQPLILAGIIAFAVVCLLCAVLLVMFIVYRMRKKDEGSYALDEPKRSPSHPYQRAPTKEYFA